MRLGVVTAGLLLGPVIATSARAEKPPPLTAEDAVYAELGGPALCYSINYDRRFGDIVVRVGMGYLRELSSSTTEYGPSTSSRPSRSLLTAPLTLSRLFLGPGKNMFELGAGATLFRSRSFFNKTSEPTLTIVPTAFAGFRSQARGGGFVLRTGIALLASTKRLDFGWSPLPWPYLAMGGAFD